MSDSSLPPGWTAMKDPSSGETYYVDHINKKSQWERPADYTAPPPPLSSVDTKASPNSAQVQSFNQVQVRCESSRSLLYNMLIRILPQ